MMNRVYVLLELFLCDKNNLSAVLRLTKR